MTVVKSYRNLVDSGVEWIGEIPANWNVASLSRLILDSRAGAWGDEPNESNINDHIWVIRVADFNTVVLGVSKSKQTFRAIDTQSRTSRLLRSGDILLEKSGGGDLQPVGRVVQYCESEPAVTSNFVTRLRVNESLGHSRLLLRSLDSIWSQRVHSPAIKQTTGIQNLDEGKYLSIRVPLPPLDEQVAIANFLDAIDDRVNRYVAAKRKMIALLEEKTQAIITQAVTRGLDPDVPLKPSGVDWLGDIPAHWALLAQIGHEPVPTSGVRAREPTPPYLNSYPMVVV